MKMPNYYEDPDGWEKFRHDHPEWTGNFDLCEMISDEKIIGWQTLNIGRTTVYRLKFSNGSEIRIHGFKNLKDPDIIQLTLEHYGQKM